MKNAETGSAQEESTTTLLVGLGKGGSALLPYLIANDQFNLVAACDSSGEAVGMPMARLCRIRLFDDAVEAIKECKPQLVIDATGDPSLPTALQQVRPAGTSVVTAAASRLLWDLLSALEGRRRSDLRYDRLLRDMNSGILVIQKDSVRFVNPAFLKLFNYASEEVLGRPYANFVSPEFRERDVGYHHDRQRGKRVDEEYETKFLDGEGGFREVLVRARLSDWDGQSASLLIMNDVTRIRALQRERERFFRFMVHELRAPLSPLVTVVPLLRKPKILENPKKMRELAELIGRSVDRLHTFIDDFLDLSKLDQETLAVKQEDVDLAAAVEEVVESQRLLAEEKGLALDVLPWDPFPLRGDPIVLRTLLQNLVNNAIKYTEEGRVEVSVHPAAGEFTVRVSDTGSGLTAEEQKNLFQEFGRIKRLEGVKGTGLGLALVRKLVDVCGGNVSVSSEGKGRGSTFSFSLPAVFGEVSETGG